MASTTQAGQVSGRSDGERKGGLGATGGGRLAGVRRPVTTAAGGSPRWVDAVRGAWPLVGGPLIMLAAVLLLEVRFAASDAAPDLGAFLVVVAAYSAFLGGVRSGLLAAAILVAYYAYRLTAPAAPVSPSAREQWLLIAVAAPLAALVSAHVKTRFDRLRDRDRVARAEAEAAERRWRFLAEASRALSASLDHEVTLANLAVLTVPDLADYCMIHVRGEDGVIRQVAVAHADPEKEALLWELERRLAPVADDPAGYAARVMRDQAPALIAEVPERWAAEVGGGPELERIGEALDPCSAMVVPLVSHGEVFGAITLVSSDPRRRYGPEDLELAEELARRAALAVENARLYEAALAASKAKSDFLAVMSHELKTPLSTIVACTDLLEAEIAGPLTQDQRDQLGHVLASALHLLQLIDEILSFSRMEAGREKVRLETVDLGALVDDAAALIRPVALDRGLGFRVEGLAEPCLARTDPPKVRQILLNLLSNAVKFTERGEVVLSVAVEGPWAVFGVRDTGIGIPPEHQERIFEAFWQVEQSASRRASGTGLGLSVTRRLCRMLGGEVSVESVPGQGSTFTVRVPLNGEVPSVEEPAVAETVRV